MSTPVGLTPAGVASAYSRVQNGPSGVSVDDLTSGADASGTGTAGTSFGSSLEQAMQNVVQTGHEADAMATQGIEGEGNITDVVMAVSRAQLALQSTVAIRDRVVQAYQDIMKISI